MAKKNLYINDVNIGTYGIYITSDTILDSPSFDYAEFQVPGRNGTLLQYKNRLNNVIRKFTCHIPFKTNVKTGIASLQKLLYTNPGYVKIASDYEPGVYMMGYLAQEINVHPFNIYKTATFDLYFSCRPEKYATGEKQTFTNTYTPNDSFAVYHRSHPFIQRVLNDTPVNYVPDDQYFIYLKIGGGSSTYTQIDCTMSESKFIAVIADNQSNSHPLVENTYMGFVGCGIGSVSISNYTAQSNVDVSIVCSLTDGTVSGTSVGSYTDTVSMDFSQFYNQYTNPSYAFGSKIEKIDAVYQMNFDAYPVLSNGTILLRGYENNVKQWEGSVCFDIPDNDRTCEELYANWLVNGDITFELDPENKVCNVVKNGDIFPFSNYVEFHGDFSGSGDTIEVAMFTEGSLAQYQGKSADVYVEWTTL